MGDLEFPVMNDMHSAPKLLLVAPSNVTLTDPRRLLFVPLRVVYA
jgi:hypothetical protein